MIIMVQVRTTIALVLTKYMIITEIIIVYMWSFFNLDSVFTIGCQISQAHFFQCWILLDSKLQKLLCILLCAKLKTTKL